MDIGSIFLILTVALIVAFFIGRPLLEQRDNSVTAEEQMLSTVMAERDRVLDALQEMDFDYQLGKIPASEYPADRAALVQQGAMILKQLDALQVNHKLIAGTDDSDDVDMGSMEEAIAVRRAENVGNAVGRESWVRISPVDDEIEALIAARRREHREKSAGFCPQCGDAVQKSDQFCSKCGMTLFQ